MLKSFENFPEMFEIWRLLFPGKNTKSSWAFLEMPDISGKCLKLSGIFINCLIKTVIGSSCGFWGRAASKRILAASHQDRSAGFQDRNEASKTELQATKTELRTTKRDQATKRNLQAHQKSSSGHWDKTADQQVETAEILMFEHERNSSNRSKLCWIVWLNERINEWSA